MTKQEILHQRLSHLYFKNYSSSITEINFAIENSLNLQYASAEYSMRESEEEVYTRLFAI